MSQGLHLEESENEHAISLEAQATEKDLTTLRDQRCNSYRHNHEVKNRMRLQCLVFGRGK